MRFESRITRTPRIFDRGDADPLGDVISGDLPAFRELVLSTASCSPFLRGLIRRDAEWANQLANRNPDDVMLELCESPGPGNPAETAKVLRRLKRRVALLVALADLGGVWDLANVTGQLTAFANTACQSLLSSLIIDSWERGRLPELSSPDECGLFALAMGKMGANELNYSSDIDLIFMFDSEKFSEIDSDSVRMRFIRIVRRFAALMSRISSDGYVFRVDLRLRPDPLTTPICISTDSAERYYESFGRTWERGAFIKARPCAGDLVAGKEFLGTMVPFVWRRNLDFAAIQDAREMRHKIEEFKRGSGPISLPGHDLKLGRGGIREIEIFAQTIQIIAGGRDDTLRVPDTVGALSALRKSGWIDLQTKRVLEGNYAKLRQLEHRLQMMNDFQTHELPRPEREFGRFSALAGEADTDAFKCSILHVLEEVHAVTEEFFGTDKVAAAGVSPAELSDPDRRVVDRWQDLPVLRNDRARSIFSRLQPQILSRIVRSANPSEALERFDAFLRGLPAGVQLFSLFEANPQLIALLADTCATSEGLAMHLARYPQVFDAVLDGSFFAPVPRSETLRHELLDAVSGADGLEDLLEGARRWMKEQHFRIGIHHLRDIMDSDASALCYSDLAEAVIAVVWQNVVEHYSLRHGSPPGRGAAVLAMGSLGGRSLTSQTKLDLLLVYDRVEEDLAGNHEAESNPHYYAGLLRSLVTAIDSPMQEGKLYEIDMRIRPSGRHGPVAFPLASFESHYARRAQPWEKLLLTQFRPIAGSREVCSEFEAARKRVLANERGRAGIAAGLRALRQEVAAIAPMDRVQNPWELRIGPGRLLDIEMVAHACALGAGSEARGISGQFYASRRNGWLTGSETRQIIDAYSLLRRILQIARLLVSGDFVPGKAGEAANELILRETGHRSLDQLGKKLQCDRHATIAAIDSVLEISSSDKKLDLGN